MYQIITTYERPSVDIPYFLTTEPELKQAFAQFVSEYVVDVILLATIDASDTVQISTASYESEETANAFLQAFSAEFPTFFEDRDNYCAANDIIVTRTTETLT